MVNINFVSIYDNVLSEEECELIIMALPSSVIISVFDEMVENLNLKDFIHKKTGELSSGQKNRVSLAKSLINKPKLLFLDEPTASLDPDVGDFVREYLEQYKNKTELTILLASHNMKEVERLCNKIVMMKQGKIVDEGTCEELINKHGRINLEDTFLKIARDKNELE